MCARPKRAPFKVSTTARVLGYLRESDGYVSGQGISQELGLSRVAIWKHIRTLRTQGCRIDACRHRGYRLIGVPDLPTEEAVAAQLHTKILGRPLLFFREVDSTNHQLAARAVDAAEGLALVADHQTAGRGRMGRAWFSPAGVNVYLSVLLRPQVNLAQITTLPLVVGCVVARAVAKLAAEVPVTIKWPNDLLVHGKKICGILTERLPSGHMIIGIGLNLTVVPRGVAQRATSIKKAGGRPLSLAQAAKGLALELEREYLAYLSKV